MPNISPGTTGLSPNNSLSKENFYRTADRIERASLIKNPAESANSAGQQKQFVSYYSGSELLPQELLGLRQLGIPFCELLGCQETHQPLTNRRTILGNLLDHILL
jgi:hypothetical protein